jgi:multiple sugar transport system permease protein
VTDTPQGLLDRGADRAARATPPVLARRVRGLSDRAIAWLFISPTIILLLAINIFPLIWTIRLSFTNYRANRPNAEVEGVGLRNYERILGDPDIWMSMQITAHFVFWTILLQTVIGFMLAYLIDRKFRGHAFWTTLILIPMMLSPAVVGNFWRSSTSRRSARSATSCRSSPACRRRRSTCSARSRPRPGRSSSSIPGCGRPT